MVAMLLTDNLHKEQMRTIKISVGQLTLERFCCLIIGLSCDSDLATTVKQKNHAKKKKTMVEIKFGKTFRNFGSSMLATGEPFVGVFFSYTDVTLLLVHPKVHLLVM